MPPLACAAASAARAGGLLPVGGLVFRHARRVADLSAASRIPAFYTNPFQVGDRGLISYGADLIVIWHRAAVFVDKILKGGQAWRPGGGAAHQVQSDHQPQDGEGPGPRDPPNPDAARRRGDRMNQTQLNVAPARRRAALIAGQAANRTGGVMASRRAFPAKPIASKVRNASQARLDAWCSASAKSSPRRRLPKADSTAGRSSIST